MPEDWLHEPKSTGAAFASVDAFDWAELFSSDFYVDSFEAARDLVNKTVSTSKVLSEFEKSIIEIGTQTSGFIPQSRVVRVIGRLVTVGKVAKLIIGSDEEGAPRKFIGVVDVDLAPDEFEQRRRIGRETFERIAREAAVTYTKAGWTVHDPVWLADPRV